MVLLDVELVGQVQQENSKERKLVGVNHLIKEANMLSLKEKSANNPRKSMVIIVMLMQLGGI